MFSRRPPHEALASSVSGTQTSVQPRISASRSASSVESFWSPESFRCNDERSHLRPLSVRRCGTDQPLATMAAWSCDAIVFTPDMYSAHCASSSVNAHCCGHVPRKFL